MTSGDVSIDSQLRGYAICAVGRSGSSWCAELLGSTGQLGHPNDYFNTGYMRRQRGDAYPVRRRDQLDLVLSEGRTPNGVYGLKVFPLHLAVLTQRVSWVDALPDLRFVHLKRRDVLGQALSRLKALQTQQWRSDLPVDTMAQYDGDGILDAMRWIILQDARWDLFFARNGIEPLRLIYEEASRSAQATVDRVAALMDVTSRPEADPGKVKVEIQRDATSDAWRARFLDEFRNLDEMDVL